MKYKLLISIFLILICLFITACTNNKIDKEVIYLDTPVVYYA